MGDEPGVAEEEEDEDGDDGGWLRRLLDETYPSSIFAAEAVYLPSTKGNNLLCPCSATNQEVEIRLICCEWRKKWVKMMERETQID
jgi:hypothetical protein